VIGWDAGHDAEEPARLRRVGGLHGQTQPGEQIAGGSGLELRWQGAQRRLALAG
jgi:hypothetical protein